MREKNRIGMKLRKIKYLIRILAIKFHDATDYYVVPVDLFDRISTNHKELRKLQNEIKELKSLYPAEREFIRAEAVIERMLILGR